MYLYYLILLLFDLLFILFDFYYYLYSIGISGMIFFL